MKPLSDRLLAEAAASNLAEIGSKHRISLLREAAALAKSVESAPVMSVSMVAEGHAVGLYLHPIAGDSPAHDMIGQRVALVPLPQQSET